MNLAENKKHLSPKHLTRPDWTTSLHRRTDTEIWLDKNENIDPELARLTQEVIIETAKDVTSIYAYPDMTQLYSKLAEHVGLTAQHIRLTPGSDGAIRTVFEAFVSPGDTVIHTAPTFAMYPVYCQMFGAKAVALEYDRTDSGPQLNFENLLQAIRDLAPRLVCLPNPDSPTGTIIDSERLRELLLAAKTSGSLVLIDEAYFPFYEHSCADLLPDFSNLIIARTFAKAWGLAGLRIGYALASPEITLYLHQVKPMYEVGTFACEVVHRMLPRYSEVLNSVKRINAARSWFNNRLNSMGFKTTETHGNFTHVALGQLSEKIHKKLEGQVLYRKNFSEKCLSGFSRFSIGPQETMSRVANLISIALD